MCTQRKDDQIIFFHFEPKIKICMERSQMEGYKSKD